MATRFIADKTKLPLLSKKAKLYKYHSGEKANQPIINNKAKFNTSLPFLTKQVLNIKGNATSRKVVAEDIR